MARKKSAAKRAREEQAKLQEPEVQEAEPENIEDEEDFKGEDFDSDASSTSEEEDDFGELITEEIEQGIDQVLKALKEDDKGKLLNPEVKFFSETDGEKNTSSGRSEKQKPIYLKDYHRMNILAGNTFESDDEVEKEEEEENDNGESSRLKTFDQEQAETRDELLSEIKNAFGDDDEDSSDSEAEDFMKRKEKKSVEVVPQRVLPNPDKNEEKFLEEFTKQHAWVPHKGDRVINLDKRGEDDNDFDEAAEKFENAYNFRFEDPNSAEIISYARNQATVRRDETGSRRKKREAEKETRRKATEEKEKEISKRKNEKINKLADILEQVRKEYGADINESLVKKLSDTLLDQDYDDSKWDDVLTEIFNDEFYNDVDEKPEWGEDDEIMKDFHAGSEGEGDVVDSTEKDQAEEAMSHQKSKKETLQDKNKEKKEKKILKELATKAIEENKLKIIDQIEEEREGRSKEKKHTFKYREVSPESFGLTTREIFLADDKDLNEYIGLKKFAPYRNKEAKTKEKRKITKSKRLREWRKKVFNSENGPDGEDDGILKFPVEEPTNQFKKRKY